MIHVSWWVPWPSRSCRSATDGFGLLTHARSCARERARTDDLPVCDERSGFPTLLQMFREFRGMAPVLDRVVGRSTQPAPRFREDANDVKLEMQEMIANAREELEARIARIKERREATP